MDQETTFPTLAGMSDGRSHDTFTSAVIYLVAFITGAIVMSFEMLGSRYLNPYFGSGIYTWAALISTVLLALTAGYFLGGWIADRTASPRVLGTTIVIASLYLVALPTFSDALLDLLLADIDDVRVGSLVAALGILLFPVTLLGVYSPFGIRLMLRDPARSGIVSGTVYGVSTAGSIVGTLGTTFVLIPLIGTKAITYTLGVTGIACGLLLIALPALRPGRRVIAAAIAGVMLAGAAALAIPQSRAEVAAGVGNQALFDESIRAASLKLPDGRVAHLETEYNDIFIAKRGQYLAMSTRFKGESYTESIVNLRDPVDLQATYTQTVMAGLVYPKELKRVLMIGLGAGSISTYIAHHMPEVTIDVVELDPGLIGAAKRYFGLRETDAVKVFDSDGRVYINRNRDKLYDLIILDAFREIGVPFHLLTKEFYTLVKQRLTPGGAVVANIFGGTKLYSSTITTLRAVFPTVDVYPEFESATERQMIAVATLSPESDMASLKERATEMQTAHRYRYSLPRLIAKRLEKPNVPPSDVLTDDFAPVNLYETIPLDKRRRK